MLASHAPPPPEPPTFPWPLVSLLSLLALYAFGIRACVLQFFPGHGP
jgi:hypothetical protein